MTKIIRITIYLILLFYTAVSADSNDWQKAIANTRDKVVLIEYYEQIISPQSIAEKSRVKRQLSGLLVNESGLIITSSSIFKASLEFTSAASIFSRAQKPTNIRVKFQGKDYQPADFIGKDDDKKLAFIKLKEKPEIPPIHFSDKPDLNLGSMALVIQHLNKRYDYEIMVNERLINAIITKPNKKYLCENTSMSLCRFGLVLNIKGKAVGIMRSSTNTSFSPIDFSDVPSASPAEIIPYSTFKELIANPPVYKEKKTARKKWLGIYMQPFTRDMAEYYNKTELEGVLINTILKDSPAQKAGLMSGDIVASINDIKVSAEQINDLRVFRKLIRGQKDTRVTFKIFRNGKYMEIEVDLGETPISQFLADEVSNSTFGLSVKELTQDIILAKQLDLDTDGVWVSKVERAGWADVAGLRIGDLILKINGQTINELEGVKINFDLIEKEKPGYFSLFIKRQTETRFLFIKTNFED